MKKLKLIQLSKESSLTNAAMSKLKGGAGCCCGCCGSSSDPTNYNTNRGLGHSCSCGNTTYGA